MNSYQIIYADCPWDYETKNSPKFGGASYPTMTTEELKSIPVALIADKNCSLFFWATYPKLKEAIEVIEAWGFKYRTNAFTWIKTNRRAGTFYSGLGHWTNANSEICLFAKKGHPKRIAKDVKELIIAPLGRHSAKPPEVRDRIVKLMGDLPRIELFARERVPGWDALGNDVDGQDIRQSIYKINVCQLVKLESIAAA
jgi:site-specific DNA-methyltransferase (adenine-specific)